MPNKNKSKNLSEIRAEIKGKKKPSKDMLQQFAENWLPFNKSQIDRAGGGGRTK